MEQRAADMNATQLSALVREEYVLGRLHPNGLPEPGRFKEGDGR
ncbi:MAG: hypothetical protein OXL40_13575 [Bacteroidota bacterium]|nr:hypothetical protein [Bacteroidota bacterium]